MKRFLPAGLIASGLALLGAAGLHYWGLLDRWLGNEGRLLIEEQHREFPDCKPNQTLTLIYRFHNPTNRPIRILGLADC